VSISFLLWDAERGEYRAGALFLWGEEVLHPEGDE
jgi:hypothetical protein